MLVFMSNWNILKRPNTELMYNTETYSQLYPGWCHYMLFSIHRNPENNQTGLSKAEWILSCMQIHSHKTSWCTAIHRFCYQTTSLLRFYFWKCSHFFLFTGWSRAKNWSTHTAGVENSGYSNASFFLNFLTLNLIAYVQYPGAKLRKVIPESLCVCLNIREITHLSGIERYFTFTTAPMSRGLLVCHYLSWGLRFKMGINLFSLCPL